jgi:hypothetical protein
MDIRKASLAVPDARHRIAPSSTSARALGHGAQVAEV